MGKWVSIFNKNRLYEKYEVQPSLYNFQINDIIINPKSIDTNNENVNVLSDNQFLVPGLIDCHIHAAQLPNLGIGYDKQLLDWLETYTFPLEKKYADANYAEQVFETVVVSLRS